ncbi:hypothetical protein PR202_ga24890 [Eleusine coracana subsp. coracana]|uniref:Uncharacterized protein n=1 Tax=Eleusine coracana subsp. coracana TaxID=191504 RepID=A0AAV5D9N1_ELECO|nr:hypothetical protein PR202_ga24890 [Eleusine coracana subsp. coracana]
MSYMRGEPADQDAEAGEGPRQARTHMAQGHGRVSALLSYLRSLQCLHIFIVRLLVLLMEYRMEKKAKKKAYKELKEIARSEGKKPPPNPYPSAIKEIQAEEKHYVHERKYNPKIIELAEKMKKERDLMLEDRKAWQ